MRTYCTGHHPLSAIAEKSGLSVTDVQALLSSLAPSGVVIDAAPSTQELTPVELRERFVKLAALWSAELRFIYIGNEFAAGELPKSALVGWLVEMYHYIHDFPQAIGHAARHARGELQVVLDRYAAQERGHEQFVLKTLVNLGMSPEEVETSAPMLSTRLIGFLMRELFELAPWSVLPVAAMIEAQDFEDAQIEAFKVNLCERYGLPVTAFDPYFEHQEIDVSMGHAELLATHLRLIEPTDRATLDQITNKMHDLLHAFDLQGSEIKAYYQSLDGKYIPRQPVTFDAI
ncbi:MAG TPA: iron-containing redox enzyme family protein, partial [Candidatus Baltobacteraceae bacterium]